MQLKTIMNEDSHFKTLSKYLHIALTVTAVVHIGKNTDQLS